MAITKLDVFSVADQIITDGGNPTLAAVRKALGGGSFTTISEWMTDWKIHRQAPPVREPAPAAISEQLNTFAAELWSKAQDLANARLTTEREALESTRHELEHVSQEAAELADQLSDELETTQVRVAEQNESLQKLTSDLARCTSENSNLIEQLSTQTNTTATAQAALLETRTRAEQLSKLLEQERQDRRSAEARAADAEKQAAVIQERLSSISKAK